MCGRGLGIFRLGLRVAGMWEGGGMGGVCVRNRMGNWHILKFECLVRTRSLGLLYPVRRRRAFRQGGVSGGGVRMGKVRSGVGGVGGSMCCGGCGVLLVQHTPPFTVRRHPRGTVGMRSQDNTIQLSPLSSLHI